MVLEMPKKTFCDGFGNAEENNLWWFWKCRRKQSVMVLVMLKKTICDGFGNAEENIL